MWAMKHFGTGLGQHMRGEAVPKERGRQRGRPLSALALFVGAGAAALRHRNLRPPFFGHVGFRFDFGAATGQGAVSLRLGICFLATADRQLGGSFLGILAKGATPALGLG